MQEDFEKSMSNGETDETKKTSVKLIRSRRETRVTFVFKGSLEETESRLQKIYKSVVNN